MSDAAELAHQIAHELKGPLMGIKGLASTATRMFDQLTDAERREFFELIDAEADRLARVADQTALLLLLEADDLHFVLEGVGLADLLPEHLDPRIHVEPSDQLLQCDPRRTAEIIAWILDNALSYSTGSVQLHAGTVGDHSVVRVLDDGPGLPTELHDRAFERFSTVRPAGAEDVAGAGLSLYLGRAIARGQGGDLTMEPAAQGGTMLTLTLPRED